MIPLAVLLAAAALAAFGLGWLIREVTRADQTCAAIPYVLADGPKRDLAPFAATPLFDQDWEKWAAMPSPLDVWEDGSCPRRRQDGER